MKALDLTFEKTDKVIELLKFGKIGVLPTDTIYGIVGSALNPETIEEIYRLRKRATDKPMIILIASLADLGMFDIQLTKKQKLFLQKIWPNPVSVILPVKNEKFKYLHCGKNSLAFRMPKDEKLLNLLKEVGPLVAPSANFEGQKPSETIDEAKKYFGNELPRSRAARYPIGKVLSPVHPRQRRGILRQNKIAFYVDGGKIISEPSTVIRLHIDGLCKILRQGGYKLV